LLIITSHPIQYQVPLFRQLADDPSIDVEVLYLTLPNAKDQGEGFGVAFEWDTPLLSGYRWRKVRSLEGAGGFSRFSALRVGRPFAELKSASSGRPDMVFVTGWHCLGLLQLFMAAWLTRIPILLRMENNDKRKRSLLQLLIHRFIVNRARFVLPVGAANSRYYKNLGVTSARMVASPYCVDNSHFASLADRERPHRQQARRQWSIPEQAFCFLFCGKLQEKKHPEDILDALQLLKKRNFSAPVHCLFVGTGALEHYLRRKSSSLNLPVTFAGFLNQGELPSAYVASDALVLPSDSLETWGLVVNEAMACGLPAIVSNQVGCADDLVDPGQTGHVYQFGDLQALSLIMESMASDPGSSRRMGVSAAKLVDQHYSLSQAAQGIRLASLFAFSGSAG
jgi:glycosyltransferase involved in cell wall biosynthesis